MNLLKAALYDPTTAASKATSSLLAMTAFDTTNLRLAITVPSHGMVRFKMRCAITGATTMPSILLGVLNGATVLGRQVPISLPVTASGATQVFSVDAEFTVTGLTPGAMNVDAAYAVQVVVASTNIKYGGPNNASGADAWGGFLFEAWDPQPQQTNGQLVVDANGRVDLGKILGTAVSTPATAGILDVNVKNMNNVAATSITTVNANIGVTQPVNFTGTGASALVKSDMQDIAGAAVATGTAQIGVNVVNFGGTAVTGRDIGASVLLSSGTGTGQVSLSAGKISEVVLVDTLTTYTGNTPQTGDSFARLTGTGAVTLASLTVSGTTTLTGAITANNAGNAITGVTSALTGDFTSTMKTSLNAATPASVTGSVGSVTGAVGSVTAAITLPAIPANWITAAGITAAALNGKGDWLLASSYTAPPSAATIAGATWDVTLSGHLTAGSTGLALNSAGAAGDPWSTALPGSYAAGTAGNIVGNNLNAAITSRMATFTLPTNFSALAVTAGGAVTAGTVSDKTGYSLSQAFPTNFAALAITAGGAVTAGTVSDKSGYSLTTAPLDAAGTRAAIGMASANLDVQLAALDTDILSRLSGSAYVAPDNSSVSAIKAKTDSLTFTMPGKLDGNLLAVNGAALTGNGTTGAPWGPA